MRVHVVSDVHGRIEALRRAGDGADALICLGDLLLFLDYADSSQGIFADLFGPTATARYIALRTAQRFDEAREFAARLWSAVPGDRREIMDQAITAQYAQIFAAMPTPAYLTYGNVDVPAMWGRHVRPGHHVLDGQCAQIGGLRFGFVGGGLRSVYRTPNEIEDAEFAAKVEAVGSVDVLCSHIPPDIPELLYDTVAQRLERGSAALLAAVRQYQPRYLLFGHVHQPMVASLRIGRTQCVNVGHFRARGTPYALRW